MKETTIVSILFVLMVVGVVWYWAATYVPPV